MTPSDLREARDALGMTQSQLAEALGVTWNTVARWETGQRKIPPMAAKLLGYIERDARKRSQRRRRS